jgi:hypothetical protein
MIYTAPCIMFWRHAYPLRRQVGGGWALEFESFLGPVHRAIKIIGAKVILCTRAHEGGFRAHTEDGGGASA